MTSTTRRNFVKGAGAAAIMPLALMPSTGKSQRLAQALGDQFDYVIAGAGHNSLLCAAYLAKAGDRVLVLEGRAMIGGVLRLPKYCCRVSKKIYARRYTAYSLRIPRIETMRSIYEIMDTNS